MIQKSELQNLISKYYLNSLIESVKWEIKDKNLIIKFTSPDRSMLGTVTHKAFDVEDSVIGINNTTQLIKLLGITNGPLDIKYTKRNKLITKMVISDNQFNIDYTVADIQIIPKSGEYKGGDEGFSIEATIDNESITAIVKAKNALLDSDTVVLKPQFGLDDTINLEMVFGGNIEYSNKVSFFIPNVKPKSTLEEFEVHYDSNTIKEIMSCNKEASHGKMDINLDGVMRLSFESENIKSEYFIVSKEI